MTIYYFSIALGTLSIITLVIFSFGLRKKNIPLVLYVSALKNENMGEYEQAILDYEMALESFKQNKNDEALRKKITEKLAILHTVIAYNNSFRKTIPETIGYISTTTIPS